MTKHWKCTNCQKQVGENYIIMSAYNMIEEGFTVRMKEAYFCAICFKDQVGGEYWYNELLSEQVKKEEEYYRGAWLAKKLDRIFHKKIPSPIIVLVVAFFIFFFLQLGLS
jgi:hypothetical protein